ncbi:hypothetical protein ACVIGB_006773 [Bradyrhizobium sp. USDA 4341]|uniref:Uncharacterized protein n=1 Tax=Bradyrhizobium erythrophlei TaxID=1437360 RepID=A0A1H5CWL7_9BRAD|nr:hypothetical protein [Bradyrhizobium erythrophlei]SED70874.1 hypothetical protein SAMN05444164_5542 [Bradyrhizobium erythrophlei]
MTARKPTPSPASLARADRQRLAAEEGARAIAEVERDGAAIRKNMERLRALREAREAKAAAEAELAPAPIARKKARVKRIVR